MFSHERQFLKKLTAAGYGPLIIFAIGASTGVWSETIAAVLPDSGFELFELSVGHAVTPAT